MSINKANQVKLALGIIGMTCFAALAPAASAKTIQPSPVWGDILSQAKLNLDSSIQQLPESAGSFSFEKLSAPAQGKKYAAWNAGCPPLCEAM
jgi:hypothetical protein